FIDRQSAQPPFFVGIDLGGTNIKIGLVDDLGRTLAFESIATEVPKGPEAGAQRIGETVARLIEQAGVRRDEVPRAGLGTPGTMDIPAGMLLNPFNLPGWHDFPIR